MGDSCKDSSSYQRAVELAYEIFLYAATVGYHLTLLDIGGGYPGSKTNESSKLFEEVAASVTKALEKYDGVNIIAEPGY